MSHESTKYHASQENSGKDRHEIANIHSHHRNHPIIRLAAFRGPIGFYTNSRYPIPERITSIDASITASLALHGRAVGLESVAYGYNGPPLRRRLTTLKNSKKLTRNASKARNMVAKTNRNMQVPAYCPVELGVQDME
jgi:hypothetical protein